MPVTFAEPETPRPEVPGPDGAVRTAGASAVGASAVGASAVGASVAGVNVAGDWARLDRLLVNLVDNAVRYAKSSVTVAVSRNDPWAEVTVTDDGPGIPAADRERAFDRFARLDDARSRDGDEAGGAGLGLAIVRATAQAYGGMAVLQAAGPPSAGSGAGDGLARGGPPSAGRLTDRGGRRHSATRPVADPGGRHHDRGNFACVYATKVPRKTKFRDHALTGERRTGADAAMPVGPRTQCDGRGRAGALDGDVSQRMAGHNGWRLNR